MDSDQLVVARIAGAVVLMFGIGVGALAIWIIERQLTLRGAIQGDAIAFVLGLSILSLFCATLGYRLVRNRPNRYQSILSPTAWIMLALSFGAMGLAAVVYNLYVTKYVEVGVSVAVSSILIYGCIRARKAAIRNGINEDAP
jgi:hypothetical protein